MNKVAKISEKVWFDYMKGASDEINASGNKPTPRGLCEEMVEKNVNENASVLSMFSLELAFTANKKSKDVTLVVEKKTELGRKFTKVLGIKYMTLEEIRGMKFDVTLMNPPFSKTLGGGKGKQQPLYPSFFSKAKSFSNRIAAIMPTTVGATGKELQGLNKSINEHCVHYADCSKWFAVLVPTQYVVWDNQSKPKATVPLMFDSLPFPEKSRIKKYNRGTHYLGVTKKQHPGVSSEQISESDVKVLASLNKNGAHFNWCDPSKTKSKVKTTTAPYVVAMPVAIKHGNPVDFVNLIETDGVLAWDVNIGIWEFEEKEQAQKLFDWMSSEEFKSIDEYWFSRSTLIQSLPWYE